MQHLPWTHSPTPRGSQAGVLWRMWISLSIRRTSPMPLIGLLLIISFLWLQTPVPRPWRSPLLSLTLGTGSGLSLPSSLVSIFLIGSSVHVFNTGWGSLCWRKGIRCLVCQSPTNLYGDHQVGCGGNGDRIHWHNSLRDALYSAA